MGLAAVGLRASGVSPELPRAAKAKVSLTSGNDQANNAFRALMAIKDEVMHASRGKRILIKPNCVIHVDDAWRYQGKPASLALSDTPAAHLEGIVEFFMHIGRHDLVIAESCATGPTFEAYDHLGYFDLERRYPVALMDINQLPYRWFEIQTPGGPAPCRFSDFFWDDEVYIVSAPKLKTHNNAIATLSLKNVVLGAPINLMKSRERHKGLMHGNSNQDLHDNMFRMAARGLVPDLAVIDGYEGMEGNGPNHGEAVPQHLALASTDFLAADRVGLELMAVADSIESLGFGRQYPAYLEYCAQAELGIWDMEQIEIVGPAIDSLKRPYLLHDEIATQVNLHPVRPGIRGYRWNPAAPHSPPLNGLLQSLQ
jgi:uncharacterized protein (DUF362 family)